VMPMHWFGDYTRDAFLGVTSDQFVIVRPDSGFIEANLRSLPKKPTVMLLTPRWLKPRLSDLNSPLKRAS
jgi:hypothetical protein